MPKYFFHIRNGTEHAHFDEVGEVLADDEAAWREAVSSAGQTLRDFELSLKAGSNWRMEVADEAGNKLFIIEVNTSRGFAGANST